jgi:DNA-binding FrmR family transcriptional regulator
MTEQKKPKITDLERRVSNLEGAIQALAQKADQDREAIVKQFDTTTQAIKALSDRQEALRSDVNAAFQKFGDDVRKWVAENRAAQPAAAASTGQGPSFFGLNVQDLIKGLIGEPSDKLEAEMATLMKENARYEALSYRNFLKRRLEALRAEWEREHAANVPGMSEAP